MKKKKPAEDDIIPMSCPVCTECYRLAHSPLVDRCHFGGPFKGYKFVNTA